MKNHRSFLLLALLALAPVAAQAHGDACPKPFQATGTVAFPADYSGVTGQFWVPAGYRLQIEQISADFRLPSATDTTDFQAGTTVGGNFAWHDLEVAQGRPQGLRSGHALCRQGYRCAHIDCADHQHLHGDDRAVDGDGMALRGIRTGGT